MAESTISKYETGTNEPDLRTLASIADALSVTIDELLGRSDTQQHKHNAEHSKETTPKTHEARIVSGGMDKLPQEQREQILNVVRAMFANHPEIFEEDDE
jgi:transcriptional regulator with XRE-family HTH domain